MTHSRRCAKEYLILRQLLAKVHLGKTRSCGVVSFVALTLCVLLATILFRGCKLPREALRAPSEPLISGDGFRFLADAHCDEPDCDALGVLHSATAVPSGLGALKMPVVFIDADHITTYLSAAEGACHGTRQPSHVVVAHNGDNAFVKSDLDLLERCPCILTMFVQNIAPGLWSPRLQGIPIGIENRYNGGLGRTPEIYSYILSNQVLRLQWRANWARRIVDAAGEASNSLDFSCPLSSSSASGNLLLGQFSLSTNQVARCGAGSTLLKLAGIARLVVPPTGGSLRESCHGLIADATIDQLEQSLAEGSSESVLSSISEAARRGAIRTWRYGPHAASKRSDRSSGDLRDSAVSSKRGPADVNSFKEPCAGLDADGSPIPTARLRAIRGASAEYHDLPAYLSALIAAPVVVSPEGHGIQCHRTWEALYAGAVPVLTLTDSPIDRLYDGLPVILLRSWDELVPGSLSGVEGRVHAVALIVGALDRIGVAMRNTQLVAALHDEQRLAASRGQCQAGRKASAPTRTAWICDLRFIHRDASIGSERDAYVDNEATFNEAENNFDDRVLERCADSSVSLIDSEWRLCPRTIETYSFEPALSSLSEAQLSRRQLYRLAHSVLHLDRLQLDYWLRVVGLMRFGS